MTTYPDMSVQERAEQPYVEILGRLAEQGSSRRGRRSSVTE